MSGYIDTYSILGITEERLVQLRDRCNFIEGDNFVSIKDGHKTPIGKFLTVDIETMEKNIRNREEVTNPINIEIIDGIDIGQLQGTLKTKDRALVQIASNFNCLEVSSVYSYPDCGDLVDGYIADVTQGPAASFGPLAASLYRAHFYKVNKKVGQTKDNQINLLDEVEGYFGIPTNGKLYLDHLEDDIDDINKVVSKIKVGLHANASVIYSRDGKHTYELDNPYPQIDQVISSTLDLSNTYNIHNYLVHVRALLRAAYEGAYLVSILRNRKVLYLTMIGGGCFQNPETIILEEIVRAHQKWVRMSNLERVYLCLYKKGSKSRISKIINKL
jgi:hypothetical protein